MKILEFFGEPLSYGGQEAFILNMYAHFREDIQYTFATPFHANHQVLLQRISARGDRLIACGYPFESKKRKAYLLRAARKMITRDYDVIHIHSGSVFNLTAAAWFAKRKKLKVIVHSHATGVNNASHRLIRNLSSGILSRSADVFLACSKEAAAFMFPEPVVRNEKYTVIKNGIDLERFAFHPEVRGKVRKQLDLEDRMMVCCVGRFSAEKNQLFLLDVFMSYRRKNPRASLLLIGGDGPAREKIQARTKELGIEEDVRLLLEREDVPDLLSAADVFVLPSLYEGLGIAAVEAQAAGLPVICSENVPAEAAVSRLFHQLPLSEGPEAWAAEIDRLIPAARKDVTDEIVRHGYAAGQSAQELEKIYLSLRQR